MKKIDPLDLLDRVGWTFAQALAGSIAAGGTAISLATFDWRAALIGAGTAAVLSLLKVLGVAASMSRTQAALLGGGLRIAQEVVDELAPQPERRDDDLPPRRSSPTQATRQSNVGRSVGPIQGRRARTEEFPPVVSAAGRAATGRLDPALLSALAGDGRRQQV